MRLFNVAISAIALLAMCGNALLMVVIMDVSKATKHRHSVEQTQFVCIQGDKIMTSENGRFTECAPIVWRWADEEGVR